MENMNRTELTHAIIDTVSHTVASFVLTLALIICFVILMCLLTIVMEVTLRTCQAVYVKKLDHASYLAAPRPKVHDRQNQAHGYGNS